MNHLADLGMDLRHALRSLRRQPGFATLVVLTLGLGIGANATVFGLLDRLLLSPPPGLDAAGRLVHLAFEEGGGGQRFTMSTTSYATLTDLRDGTRSFAGLAATAIGPMVLGRGAEATAIRGAKVTGGYFRLLGAHPESGRFFAEAEDRPPSGEAVAVISHAFWQHQLAGDRRALGREIVLDDQAFVVVGIAPPGFTGDGVEPIDAWVPLSAGMRGLPADWRAGRDFNLVALLARLGDGVAPDAARADATAAYRRGRLLSGRDAAAQSAIRFLPLRAAVGPDGLTPEGRIALWMGGVTLAVLLIAVANVTNLLLLRTARRQREIAVRLALGMSRWRLVRLWTTEGMLLALLGGAAGLLVIRWGEDLARLTLLPELAPSEAAMQPRVLLLALAAALAAGLVAGLLPARQASATAVAQRLDTAAQARSFRRSRLLTGLLLLQTSLSAALLIAAGLFVTSLQHARTQNLGFTTERTLLAEVPMGAGGGRNRDDFYREGLRRIVTLPGVEMAIPVMALPFGAHTVPPISVPGLPGAPGDGQQLPFMNAAVPEYFRMMGMTLLRGRGFTAADGPGAPLVVVVSETMARTLWPHQDALGKCIRIGFAPGEEPSPQASPSLPCREVVGVVNDARRRSIRPETIPIMQYYVPFEQAPLPPFPGVPTISGLLVRTAGEPAALAKAVQRALQSVGADAPFVEVRPYQELLAPQIRPWRLGARLLSTFGGLALAMAAIGLYGLLATMVAQRRREIGIRMALGAGRRRVVRGIVGEGLAIALPGLAAGGLVIAAGGRWLEPLLFGVTPRDPVVLGSALLTLAAVAALASLVPALRAARVEPRSALQAE